MTTGLALEALILRCDKSLLMKEEMILAFEYNKKPKRLKTRNQTLTSAMTGHNALAIKLFKPSGEKAIVSS